MPAGAFFELKNCTLRFFDRRFITYCRTAGHPVNPVTGWHPVTGPVTGGLEPGYPVTVKPRPPTVPLVDYTVDHTANLIVSFSSSVATERNSSVATERVLCGHRGCVFQYHSGSNAQMSSFRGEHYQTRKDKHKNDTETR